MEQARARNKQTPPFQVTREYKLFHGDEPQPASDVKAEINVTGPTQRDYKIVASNGSDRGERVVRKILDHEVQSEKMTPPPSAIISENYNFNLEGRQEFEGVNCYVLGLKPQRQEPGLIEGRAWVDPVTFDLRKIEGKLAKSPSFWVREVNVSVNFGEMGGIWTQVASHAVADVRVLGKYTVQGQVLDLQASTAVASNLSAQKKMPARRRSELPAAFVYGSGSLARR